MLLSLSFSYHNSQNLYNAINRAKSKMKFFNDVNDIDRPNNDVWNEYCNAVYCCGMWMNISEFYICCAYINENWMNSIEISIFSANESTLEFLWKFSLLHAHFYRSEIGNDAMNHFQWNDIESLNCFNDFFNHFFSSTRTRDHLFTDQLYMEMALTPQLQEVISNGSMMLSVISYKNLTNFLPRMYFERST